MNRDTELLAAINSAADNAYGNNGQLSEERALAIRMYLGENVDPAEEGRCQVVSKDVFDTIEWIKPSLLKIFTGQEDVVKFGAVSPEDEDAADQETAYVNHIVTQKNNWFQICNDWFTSALLTKNAYAMAYWDETERVQKETYEGQSDEALALLLQDGAEVVEHTAVVDEVGEQRRQGEIKRLQDQLNAALQAQDNPQAQQDIPMLEQQLQGITSQPPPQLHDVTIVTRQKSGGVKICVLPSERCKVDEGTTSFMLTDCNYFEYWEPKTISQLRSMGLEVPEDVADDVTGDSQEEQARDRYFENTYLDEGYDFDPSMRKVKCRMVWIRFDYDGDGIAELQYCLVVGEHVLYRQDCTRIPISCIVPVPVPHRHIGLSIADVIADVQDVKTEILRQGIDNLRLSNNPRIGVSDKVNLDDLLVSRPNGLVRVDGVPAQEMMPIQSPFVFPQAMQGLEYLDQVRENRTGTNRYFTGIDQNALNKTATGIKQLTSSAAQRVEEIARVFSVGVEELFSIVHELILKHGRKRDVVNLRGKWVEVNPTEWRERKDYKINVGVGAANQESRMGHFRMILEAQKEAFPLGVATAENIYNALSEVTKAAGFANPDKFWTDPSKAPPKPPDPKIEAEKAKLEAEKKALEVDKKGLEVRSKEIELTKREQMLDIGLKEAQIGFGEQGMAQREQEMNRAYEMLHGELNRTVEQRSQEGSMMLAQGIQSLQETAQMQSEAVGQALQALAQATQMIAMAAERMSAPKRVVRGEDGRVVGVETIGSE